MGKKNPQMGNKFSNRLLGTNKPNCKLCFKSHGWLSNCTLVYSKNITAIVKGNPKTNYNMLCWCAVNGKFFNVHNEHNKTYRKKTILLFHDYYLIKYCYTNLGSHVPMLLCVLLMK